ncbi:MAG: carotenoid biosynthesis protein [Candidatus Limnocylindrales bacterium]
MRRRPVLWAAIILLGLFAYDAVLRSLLIGLVALPLIPGGLKVLTAVLALFSLAHSWYSIGGRLTATFFVLSAAISWAYEEVGVVTGLVFGAYHYTDYLGARLGEVQLLIPLAWFMMIYPSYVIANLVPEGRPIGTPNGIPGLVRLAAVSALVMTAWDLVIDPILSGPSVRAWIWDTGGPYFGIPIHNYLGWLLTTFTVYLAYRAVEQRRAAGGAWARGAWARGAGGAWARGTGTRGAGGAWAGGTGGGGTSTGGSSHEDSLGAATAALPVAAYGLMLVADLLSGVAPAGLAVIGPVVMGLPLAAVAWRTRRSRMAVDRLRE